MKVELNIQDDKELRNVIKDMIRGQVRSLIRDELKTIVQVQVTESFSNGYDNLKGIIHRSVSNVAIDQHVEKYLKDSIDFKMEQAVFDKALEMLDVKMNSSIAKAVGDRIAKTTLNVSLS